MAITFDKSTKTFYLDGKNTTYAFFINNRGYLEHLYFGKKIAHDFLLYTRAFGGHSCEAHIAGPETDPLTCYNVIGSELTTHGLGDFREPTLHAEHAEGDRLTELLFDSYEILKTKPMPAGLPAMRDGGDTLIVHLYDETKAFAADLYYTVYPDCDVVARRIVYRNERDEKVTLRRAYSFAFTLPKNSYDAISLFGAWAKERQIDRTPLHHGVFSIDSKRTSSSATINPFLAIVERDTTETLGDAYGISLVYSSSFALKAECTPDGRTSVLGGINDFDFKWTLAPGESLETPEAILAYSWEGIGGMSRALHDAMRDHLINPKFVKKSRPVVINNWEGTYFNFDTEKLCAIASAVAGTGIDTFVLDDGWFGVRNSDTSGLGDWFVNTEKLPGGLNPVIEHVNSLGMKFGLWFEPEMINPDSDIFRAHPDYAIGSPDREHCITRNQYVMDITREDVRDYIVKVTNDILDNHHIEYVKWDYNRNVTESYSKGRDPEYQGEFAHRYALGFYDLCKRIVEAHPDIIFEGCAGGGARFDAGVLYYFPQIWTSDDSDAEERTKIQYGTSLAYPLSAMSCHVSVVPNHQTNRVTDMKTRADIAHLGATGYELDTSSFTDEDRALTAAQVKEYKEMEDLVLEGDLFRLDNPLTSNYFAFMLVSKDKCRAEVTYYRRMSGVARSNEIKYTELKGLAPEKKYYCPELGLILSGSTLMNVGIPLNFEKHDFATVKLHFEEK